MTTERLTVVTDRRTPEPPLVQPDTEQDVVITPQTPVTLRRIMVVGIKLHLTRLQIGCARVAFDAYGEEERLKRHTYRPTDPEHVDFCESASAAKYCGCWQLAGFQLVRDGLRLPAGIDVRLTLRNISFIPSRAIASLLVDEVPA